MKKYIILIMVLCGLASMNYAGNSLLDDDFFIMNHNIRRNTSFMSCLPSTIASGIVGAFTGGLTRYLEREFKIEKSKEFVVLLMIIWWIEHKVRHNAINSLEEDFAESDIPHKKSFMSFSAWVSSWIAYFNM